MVNLFNPETNVYRLRNTINADEVILSVEDFNKLQVKSIKKDEFSRLMNIYFKDVKHEWEYEQTKFKKIDNFESSGSLLSTNYVLGKDVPFHNFPDKHMNNLILVYHWGKVYYHTISYNGYAQGQLIDPYTMQYVRWAQLKHCSPIFNINTKQII